MQRTGGTQARSYSKGGLASIQLEPLVKHTLRQMASKVQTLCAPTRPGTPDVGCSSSIDLALRTSSGHLVEVEGTLRYDPIVFDHL
jgi:hypothetical protein